MQHWVHLRAFISAFTDFQQTSQIYINNNNNNLMLTNALPKVWGQAFVLFLKEINTYSFLSKVRVKNIYLFF